MAYIHLVEEHLNFMALWVREYIGFGHQIIWIWYARLLGIIIIPLLLGILWDSQMLYTRGNRDLRGSKEFISSPWLEEGAIGWFYGKWDLGVYLELGGRRTHLGPSMLIVHAAQCEYLRSLWIFLLIA